MSWDHERSKERVKKELERLQKAGLSVSPLTREMDLNNLSPSDARLVHGVHVYSEIANFDQLLAHDLMSRDEYKRLHRYLHVIQVELRRVVQAVFDGDKIQVQGSRFHGLLFKPYDDDEGLAVQSVLAAFVL